MHNCHSGEDLFPDSLDSKLSTFHMNVGCQKLGPTLRNFPRKKLRLKELCFLINFSTVRTVKLKNKVGAELSHPIFSTIRKGLTTVPTAKPSLRLDSTVPAE